MARLFSFSLLAFAVLTPPGLIAQNAEPTDIKATDWPQFRGAKRDNHSPDKNLLKKWPKEGPKLLWKSDDVGRGYSSVIAVGDRVYTVGEKDGAAYAFALNRKDGKQVWEKEFGKAGRAGGFDGTRSTPTYNDGMIFVLSQHGELACLDAAKGTIKWSKDFKKDYKGSVGGWAYSESVLVDGDRVICTPGGRQATMVALNKKTGKEEWKAALGDQAGYSSIVIATVGGIKQYVQLTQNGTIGVSAKDGKELWRFSDTGRNTANIPTPVVLGNQIYTAAGYGKGAGLLTLSKDSDGGISMKKEYFKRALTNKHGGVVVVGKYVFGDYDDHGGPQCAEWKTGDVKWQKKGRGNNSASLTYADGHLYIRYQDGWMALVPANGDEYKEVGGFKIPNVRGPSWAHPVVIGGKMYLREQGTVYCYDVSAK